MLRNDQRAIVLASNNTQYQYQENNEVSDHDDEQSIREIHALTPPPQRRPSSLSIASSISSENFTTMSNEFNALVLAGSTIANHGSENNGTNNSSNNIDHSISNNSNNLGRIGEEDDVHGGSYDDNPLAIVPDHNPLPSPSRNARIGGGSSSNEVSVMRVKREEVESKISAWQTAKIAKINNRFKREDAVISGLENEEVQKASSWMKKVERKLEEKRAKALEKMQNDIAKARRKAEEKRASAEAKRGTKVAKVMEITNLMRAVGRPPAKRSFF
ncbi:hypothetical protein LIER_13236 [Lithospermum erythrorhizon]|uniref:Remorin C-terminal domain-containing protein n=1 Tax=Lithospermum erythrorhizon TaxID=34254 RepID=A0AAV3PUQ1_LITER